MKRVSELLCRNRLASFHTFWIFRKYDLDMACCISWNSHESEFRMQLWDYIRHADVKMRIGPNFRIWQRNDWTWRMTDQPVMESRLSLAWHLNIAALASWQNVYWSKDVTKFVFLFSNAMNAQYKKEITRDLANLWIFTLHYCIMFQTLFSWPQVKLKRKQWG